MATVEPVNRTRFRNIFRDLTDDISKGLSTGRTVADDGHWAKCSSFFRYVYLNPPLVSYRDLVPIIDASAR